MIVFDFLRTKIRVIDIFGKKLLAKKKVKNEKFKMLAKTGRNVKV